MFQSLYAKTQKGKKKYKTDVYSLYIIRKDWVKPNLKEIHTSKTNKKKIISTKTSSNTPCY